MYLGTVAGVITTVSPGQKLLLMRRGFLAATVDSSRSSPTVGSRIVLRPGLQYHWVRFRHADGSSTRWCRPGARPSVRVAGLLRKSRILLPLTKRILVALYIGTLWCNGCDAK